MQKLRKAFVASVMMVTVLSMSMLTVPMQVGAAVAQNGDLIKMEGLSSVYYLAGGKRYVFPNEATYFSWYSDFSGVVTVPQSELESYPLGANVTMRAGTKLVKITTDPKVYAVEPDGKLLHVPSEAVAMTLYGADWAKRVVDIADAFFTNYTVSTETVSASAYPEGSLVKFGGAADIYYIDADGSARKVADEAALAANRFKMSDVITATIVMPTAGANITATETTLVDVSQSGAAVGITPGAGTGLSVSLASDTPASVTTLTETGADGAQAMIPVLKVNFTASADGAVQVNTVKFKRNHVPSADADFAEFYLYDGETLLAKYNSISEGILTFTKTAGLFTVPAGTTKGITLKVNLDKDVAASRSYNFSILTAADVVTNGATVSGTFPATGNAMTTANVSDLGKLTLTHSTDSTAPDPGKTDHSLWTFTAQATDQDIQIEKMKFTIIGTVDATDLTNFYLEVGGAKITPVVASMASDKTVTFNFATPYVILKGNTKTVNFKSDVVGGTSRTYRVYVYDKEDVMAKDKEYGVYVTPNQSDTYTKISAANATTINSGSLTVSKNLQSPSGNIASGAVNVEIGKFDFKATGEAIKIDTLYLFSDESLYQVKAYVDGSQVGTASNLTASQAATTSLGNSFIIPAGTTKTLVVKADIKNGTSPYAAKTDDTAINFQLGQISSSAYTLQTSGGTDTTGAVAGNSLTAKTGTLTAAENLSFGDRSSTNPTGVVNSVAAKVASFVLTAGSGEGVTVTQISLADYDAATLMGDNFQNMKLMHGTTQIGTTIGTLNATAVGNYDFSPSPAIKIAAGEQYVVDVYADIKSGATQSGMNMSGVKFAAVTATGDVTATDASYNPNDFELQTMYISSVGALYISDDSATPDAAQLVMGATDQEIAKFKLEASPAENLSLTKIIISDSVSSAATGTLTNIKLYDGDTLIAGPVQFSTTLASTTYVHAAFNVALTVPANGSKTLTVKADVSTADAGAVTGSTHTFGILANPDSTAAEAITVKGASSGTVLTVSGSTLKFYSKTDTATNLDQTARQMTVYRTKLSVAWASDTPSGSAVGMSDATVAKIVVTNSANVGSYAATVKAMNFAISHTGISNTATRTLKVYKDTITIGNLVATTSWVASQNFGNTALTNGTSNTTNFVTTEISAGSTKTFIVLVDTSDAGSDDKFSIYMDASNMTWNDGTSGSSDITSVNTLPLSAKTLTY